jgi:hypothetical protein
MLTKLNLLPLGFVGHGLNFGNQGIAPLRRPQGVRPVGFRNTRIPPHRSA